MKAGLLTIGDEVLIGQTIDTNASYIAQELNQIGIEIIGKQTVADSKSSIIDGLNHLSKEADIIIATGGLGPTKDDITKQVIAEYLGLNLVFNPEVFETIQQYFKKFNRKITEAHRLQAYMPEGITLLSNKLGTAPGMWYEKNQKIYCFMPGVPYEMRHILNAHILPKIYSRYHPNIVHKTFRTAGAGETQLADLLAPVIAKLPEHFSVAYLPDLGTVRIRLTARGKNFEALSKDLEKWSEPFSEAIQDYIYGYEKETLSEALGKLLLEKGWSIGTAESCTGGYIAHQIITPAGASRYFSGSLVTYSYGLKKKLLGVKESTLLEYGAVSEETVTEMLAGLFQAIEVDVGIAVSGIAGPDGGTPDKPVGTVWIAYGQKDNIKTIRIQASKQRSLNIKYTAHVAINLMIKFIKSNK